MPKNTLQSIRFLLLFIFIIVIEVSLNWYLYKQN